MWLVVVCEALCIYFYVASACPGAYCCHFTVEWWSGRKRHFPFSMLLTWCLHVFACLWATPYTFFHVHSLFVWRFVCIFSRYSRVRSSISALVLWKGGQGKRDVCQFFIILTRCCLYLHVWGARGINFHMVTCCLCEFVNIFTWYLHVWMSISSILL